MGLKRRDDFRADAERIVLTAGGGPAYLASGRFTLAPKGAENRGGSSSLRWNKAPWRGSKGYDCPSCPTDVRA